MQLFTRGMKNFSFIIRILSVILLCRIHSDSTASSLGSTSQTFAAATVDRYSKSYSPDNGRNATDLTINVHERFSTSIECHNEEKNIISDRIQRNYQMLSPKKIALKRKIEQSHCPRPQDYKDDSLQIDLSKMNKIIQIIPLSTEDAAFGKCGDIAAAVDVQAMMSMEDMVDALLPHNLIPAVVPEFKGITIGGSIQGLAAESTSFSFGFVHDAILGFEVVLGNGEVKWCSRESNTDLFYALPGSFGSLGICTRVRVLCLHAKPFVHIVSRLHPTTSACVAYLTDIQDRTLQQQQQQQEKSIPGLPVVDFMEGIAYGPTKVASIIAAGITDEERRQDPSIATLPIRRCNGWGNDWFFNQVKYQFKSMRAFRFFRVEDYDRDIHTVMPIKDYLFRHDQGSFWMASYRIPQFIGRVMGPLLDSTNMFKLATLLPWAFPKHVIALQDCMVPRARVMSFVEDMEALLGIYPLWILPMRNLNNASGAAVFSIPQGQTGHLVNIGIYGIPSKRPYRFKEDNIELERILHDHDGRKVFYSHSFYERDFFYNKLYDGRRYFQARKMYHADTVFPEIYNKVVTKAGRL